LEADVAVDATIPPAELLQAFREAVLSHYREHCRDLPWRRTRDPYSLLVSEVMLQQTQVARVLLKYQEFLTVFPTITALSAAPTAQVLTVWQGLGYNRRALALQRAAQIIAREHQGVVPGLPVTLRRLPGIGPATAAAVCVFAYDTPLAFIETNIRAAFIQFFFQECVPVPDAAILPLVELTLDRENPRDWYYALMDYGVWAKKLYGNPSRRSRHHTVQSPFAGSNRQLRAAVLRALLSATPAAMTPAEVQASLPPPGADATQIGAVLRELSVEGFLVRTVNGYRVA
jgi:A/G-specific adenine glycosylase